MYKTIFISVVSSLVGSGILSFIFKTYFSERIKIFYEEKIENLKGQINLTNSIVEKTINSLENTNQITQQERVIAIKKYWNNFIIIKNLVSDVTHYDRIFLESEFNSIFTPKWNDNQIVPATLKKLRDSNIFKTFDDLEREIEINIKTFFKRRSLV